MSDPLMEAEVPRSIRLAPNYSDWTKARLIERLEELQNKIDKREAVDMELSRLAAIVESSADAIISWSVDGIITAWNAAAEEMYGYAADEAIGESISLIAPAERQDEYREITTTVGLGDRVERFETVRRCKDGRLVHAAFSVSPIGDSAGNVVGISATIRDIGERKQAEDRLKESEERFRAIFDNSPSAIFLKDLDGRYRLVNKKFETWYGTSQDEIAGKSLQDVRSNKIADAWSAIDREVLETDSVVERDLEIRLADGSVHCLSQTKFPVYDGHGKTVWIGTIQTDITDRKKAEEQFRQAQKMEAVGQLTGGVAHDFNNLLSVILGNAELLKDQFNDDGGLIERIERAASRGADLTHRLLTFSRRRPLQRKLTDINASITDMLDLLQRTLGETIEIKMATCADRWNVETDPAQLESAILNIAINARHAMPEGGTLEIEIANVALDDAVVAPHDGCPAGNYVRLAVSDSGVGMSPDVLEHAFEPFFTTKDVGEGTGLGLSMIYGFAKQSGGFVEIESEQGRGCTLRLYLPLAIEMADAVAANDADLTRPRTLAITVLVVEDDPDVRSHVVRLLTDLGCSIVEAEDGATALQRLGGNPDIDLLFADIVLPHGMSGPDVAREARRSRPDLKIVFTSGYPDKEILDLAWDGERPRIVSKPYRRADLSEALFAAMNTPSRTARSGQRAKFCHPAPRPR